MPGYGTQFWAAALARLRAQGVTDPEDDPTVLVEAPRGPPLFFQRVPEPTTVGGLAWATTRTWSETTAP